jgi:hypothetical protein
MPFPRTVNVIGFVKSGANPCQTEVTAGARYETVSVTVPTSPWIVKEIGCVLPIPLGTIHHIVVSSFQSCMPTIAVEPSLARYVVAACPKLVPSSEIPKYWLHARLAGPAIETLGASYDRMLEIVPPENPEVTTWEILPLVPLEA